MSESQGNASLGIEQYLFVIVRQWRLIAAATILGGLLAGLFLAIAPKKVTATTTINLNVITTDPFSSQRAPSGLLDDATETAIARSHVVATSASEILDGDMTASEIRRHSTVSTSSGATVVTVDFEAENGADAVKGADAVAAAYLSFRENKAEQRIDVMVTNLTERIDALNETLSEVNRTLASAAPGSVESAQATSQRQQILTELDGLLSERNGLQSVDTTGGIVLSAADDNELGHAPGRTSTLLTGVGLGFVIGVVGVFVWNPFDRRLRNAKEMVVALNAPVFATVEVENRGIPATGETADALRVTRERLLVDLYLGTIVLVIDATHAEETSSTAVNLAVVTAQAGYGVQLILPEASEAFADRLRLDLRLQQVADGSSTSESIPTLSLFEAEDRGDEAQGDLLLTRDTHTAIENAGDDSLTYLVLSSTAHPASILSALRVARSVVIVFREKATTSTEVRWLREEAVGIETPVLGGIAEKASSRSSQRSRGGEVSAL